MEKWWQIFFTVHRDTIICGWISEVKSLIKKNANFFRSKVCHSATVTVSRFVNRARSLSKQKTKLGHWSGSDDQSSHTRLDNMSLLCEKQRINLYTGIAAREEMWNMKPDRVVILATLAIFTFIQASAAKKGVCNFLFLLYSFSDLSASKLSQLLSRNGHCE